MDDMLTFITKHMKRKGNMVMQDLMDACKMSRAKYYKCLKEPIRFSDEELEAISTELNLSENERGTLFAYKHFTESEPVQKRSLANVLIERTVFGYSDIVTDPNAMIFKVFEEGRGESVANVLSSDTMAAKFNARIAEQAPNGKKLPLEILIFNAHQEEKTHVLYALLRSLDSQSNVKAAHEISIRHFILEEKAEEKEAEHTAGRKIQYYANLTPLAAYGNYSITFSQQVRNVFFGTTDSVMIRYKNKEMEDRYLVLNIISKSDVSVYSFSDSNLNAFFSYNFSDLLAGAQKRNWVPNDVITVNPYLAELIEQYPKILITREPCFDCMIAKLWDAAEANIRENMDAPSKNNPGVTLIEALRKYTDPTGQSAICTNGQFITTLFSQFRKRFEISEGNNAINLITPAGLKYFAETGTTTEMKPAELSLPPDLVIEELEYIKARLGKIGGSNGQSFYLINHTKKALDKMMMIFRNKMIAYLVYRNDIPDTNWQAITDPEVTDLFYSHIAEVLLSDAKRSAPDALLMSDAWSNEFLDGLIDSVRQRMNKAE